MIEWSKARNFLQSYRCCPSASLLYRCMRSVDLRVIYFMDGWTCLNRSLEYNMWLYLKCLIVLLFSLVNSEELRAGGEEKEEVSLRWASSV